MAANSVTEPVCTGVVVARYVQVVVVVARARFARTASSYAVVDSAFVAEPVPLPGDTTFDPRESVPVTGDRETRSALHIETRPIMCYRQRALPARGFFNRFREPVGRRQHGGDAIREFSNRASPGVSSKVRDN